MEGSGEHKTNVGLILIACERKEQKSLKNKNKAATEQKRKTKLGEGESATKREHSGGTQRS